MTSNGDTEMRTPIHNVAPKTSAERIAALTGALDKVLTNAKKAIGEPEPVSNKFKAPAADDDAQPRRSTVANKFTAPAGE